MRQPIPGLRYIRAYLESATHDRLFDVVDAEPWLMSVDHRVQIYGYGYHHAKRAAHRVRDLPPWACDLAERLCRDGLVPAVADQLVVNDYPPGTGIFPHVDQAVFGDTVASVSLGSSCVMQFTHAASARVEEVFLEPRSVLVLSGEARWHWRHEIPARLVDEWEGASRPRSRRVSLTFRVMPGAGT
jgi:alkylated DNA repair dioxygenase AlkB